MITTRRIVQLGFLCLTVVGVFVVKGNAERWCPFGGVEALYSYATQGELLCSLGTSNFFILGGILLLTLLTARSFCGYVCPIGTISSWLNAGTRALGFEPLNVRGRLDAALSLLKLGVLVLVLIMTVKTSELWFRGIDPCYAIISRHGEDITFWAYVVLGAVLIGSVLLVMPFCRWLCPFAPVLNIFSRFSLTRIRRSDPACTGCAKCTRVCPMNIPVHQAETVTQARCMSCMECMDACRKLDFNAITWGPANPRRGAWPQWVVAPVVLACITAAVTASYLAPFPAFTRSRGVEPEQIASVELEVDGVTCRGRGSQLTDRYLFRTDDFALTGYLKVEAWPGPGFTRLRVSFDPSLVEPDAVADAIAEPVYDPDEDIWWTSPFTVKGHDPFKLP